jgi:hypothetical protein
MNLQNMLPVGFPLATSSAKALELIGTLNIQYTQMMGTYNYELAGHNSEGISIGSSADLETSNLWRNRTYVGKNTLCYIVNFFYVSRKMGFISSVNQKSGKRNFVEIKWADLQSRH